MEKIVILSDQHARYHDRRTEDAVLNFLSDFKPNLIVNNGDLFDFEALSSFRKTLAARASLEEDKAWGNALLCAQRAVVPDAEIVLIEGNHEERLERYLLDNAEALSASLNVPGFCELPDYVEYIGPYGMGLDWHGVLVYHGSRLGINPSKAELLDAGTSGVSGHTHRLGSYYHTDRSGAHAWYMGGCLCNINGPDVPPSFRGPRLNDWQQGFVVGIWDETWSLYQVSITDHKFIFDGKRY